MESAGEVVMKFWQQLTFVKAKRAHIFQSEISLPFYLNFHLFSFIYTLSVAKDCPK